MSLQNSFSVTDTVQVTTSYSLTVSDLNNCISKPDTAVVKIPDLAPSRQWDTLVIIGQQVPINAYAGTPAFSYSWTPLVQDLSCVTCFNPLSTTTVDLTYTVAITDEPRQCFTTYNTFSIRINPLTSLDVPSAFTPNGDGTNDIIYADGWGIRKLLYFRIYNRWGQLLFDSNDQRSGWDGTFRGSPQNMENYVYQAAAETYLDKVITKTGSFRLLR
jgi:gliding motility-associated-like protein